jgi:flagellar secretion chaperone FliS
MSYASQASTYREREILTASPARLVVLLFQHAHSNLLRARRAVETQNHEERVAAVGKARDVIMELMATLNMEQGGQIAKNLRALYAFVLTELSDVARRPDGARLEAVIRIVSELHTAFATVAVDSARVPAA